MRLVLIAAAEPRTPWWQSANAIVGSGVVGAVVGAFMGYWLRAAEFRREQRLKVYADFVTKAHVALMAGAALVAGKLVIEEDDARLAPLRQNSLAAYVALDQALGQVTFLASPKVHEAAEQLFTLVGHCGAVSLAEHKELASEARLDIHRFARESRSDVIGRYSAWRHRSG